MDNRIRKNEICGFGLPSCDYVFSSTRSCFIAYGFQTSPMEVQILTSLLEKHGIEAIEAAGFTNPGQHAFCTKICSKMITSQFCIVLLNNDVRDGMQVPNANVNMEYGLLLGYNKYIIPFQKEDEKLPFNVAGLDTIKYTNTNFSDKAEKEIIKAIENTQQKTVEKTLLTNERVNQFLLTKNLMVSPIDSEGERNLYRLGEVVGFNLLVDFDGNNYTYLGNFTALKDKSALIKTKKLIEILESRHNTIHSRAKAGTLNVLEYKTASQLFSTMKILIIVTGQKNREHLKGLVSQISTPLNIEVVSDSEVQMIIDSEVIKIGK